MAKKSKRYVVRKGRQPGVYPTRDQCQQVILHYPGATYKSFSSKKLADEAFALGYKKGSQLTVTKSVSMEGMTAPILPSISVDAACSSNPGVLEWQGVDTDTGKRLFHHGPFDQGTVNIGEFLALVQGLKWLSDQGLDWPVYSDSRTAIAWVRRKQFNTTLVRTSINDFLFRQLEKAQEWLHHHHFSNSILKRETKQWGEIPADFGRK